MRVTNINTKYDDRIFISNHEIVIMSVVRVWKFLVKLKMKCQHTVYFYAVSSLYVAVNAGINLMVWRGLAYASDFIYTLQMNIFYSHHLSALLHDFIMR